MDDQEKKSTVVRNERGQIISGANNPGGRPKAFREYQEWLAGSALEPAKEALLRCLHNEDGKVQMMAVKEVADRLFGKAPMTVLGEDGKPLLSGFTAELLAALGNLKK